MKLWTKALDECVRTLASLRVVLDLTFEPAVRMLLEALANGRQILCCGNGGSAAHAAHLAGELSVRYREDRRALAAVALIDATALTACANDYGYARIFARQLEALARPGDVLVAFSTSGQADNVNEAVRFAKHRGIGTLGLSGNRGIIAGCDVDIVVPSNSTARIQEAHQLVIHMLCEEIEARLPKGEDPRYRQQEPGVGYDSSGASLSPPWEPRNA